jgi:hypothetical protein
MFGNDGGVLDKLKSFDVYRKLPKDYLKPTFIGAVCKINIKYIVSVISITLMVILFMNEFSAFVKIKTTSEMLVDTNVGADKLKINLDVIMKKLPCYIVSLDSQDVMGTHSLNIHGKFIKKRIDKDGKFIANYEEKNSEVSVPDSHGHENIAMPDYDTVKKAVENSEGCQLVGFIEVLRVPGNVHISCHAYGQIISRLSSEGLLKLDISHIINHISFGNESDINHIKNNFDQGILNPIDGISKSQGNENKVYEYYLKVVPTVYTDIDGNSYNVHQFTSNSNEVPTQMMIPTIFFRYDISPILIKISQHKENYFHFFVQICAIVGGMFTVVGILDHLLHKMTRSISKSD